MTTAYELVIYTDKITRLEQELADWKACAERLARRMQYHPLRWRKEDEEAIAEFDRLKAGEKP